jgi:hypothetical protein
VKQRSSAGEPGCDTVSGWLGRRKFRGGGAVSPRDALRSSPRCHKTLTLQWLRKIEGRF